MLVARRRAFLKRMGEISLGIPADMGIENAVREVKPSPVSSATTTLVETALVVAIIAEASIAAYFYRDQLAAFFTGAVAEPRVQEVTPLPAVATLYEVQGIVSSPALTAPVPSATVWSAPSPTGIAVTPTGTPIPGVADNNAITATGEANLLNSATTGEPNLLNSTPVPNNSDSSGTNGNNGNHYGQTPKPERTKENGNNPPPKEENDTPPKDNNDKPPKDNNDKPPKNQ
jgi:hypothetical protein